MSSMVKVSYPDVARARMADWAKVEYDISEATHDDPDNLAEDIGDDWFSFDLRALVDGVNLMALGCDYRKETHARLDRLIDRVLEGRKARYPHAAAEGLEIDVNNIHLSAEDDWPLEEE